MTTAQQEADSPSEQAVSSTMGSGVDFVARVVYLVGEINDDSAYRFMIGFRHLDDTTGPITIAMVSAGGSEHCGYTLYDLIRLAQNPVTIDCYGVCMSIAALVLQAGSRRRLAAECRFMVHNGHVDLSSGVEAGTLVALGQEVARNNLRYQTLLAEHSGVDLKKVTEFCEKETYLSAAQAVEMGFADEIILRATPPKKRRVTQLVLDQRSIRRVFRELKIKQKG